MSASIFQASPLLSARRGTRSPLRRRLLGLTTVIAAHGLAVYLLWQVDGVREAITAAAPIMVEFIAPPPEPERVRPKLVPPKERARPTAPVQAQTPVLTTTASDPAPAWSAPLVPVPPLAPLAPPLPPSAPVTAAVFNAAYLHNPPPVYPPQARRRGEEGRVALRVFVSAAGLAERIEVQTSSGSSLLDQAAQDAVRRWQFVPAHQGQRPLASWVVVPIQFKLGD